MLARLSRVFKSFLSVSAIAASPLKAITGIVISVMVPYLLYAFLGGFGIALALVGLIWGIIWLSKRNN
ncbi:MAG: hypothetical protein HUJ22_07310 [Gracilimonas sp.]|uniref:hypothetical protein n=1 Tax=Gracilimonas sp. TaxID=1974203 RepID=UPI00198632C1|nr:hypothetical protein [Gracilimonas sp.]MBD3616365.1 hypothetical protein [Gracilimonas sp.]